jgi:predicted DNA-binding transcriptional regulator YafY
MRHEKVVELLQLAQEMQGLTLGLSLYDIEERLQCSHRTAQRLMNAIRETFPQTEEAPSYDNIKRWRIPSGTLDKLVSFTADELADIEAAISVLKRDNLLDHVASLQSVGNKIRLSLSSKDKLKIEPDVDALLEAEGIAMRPGPRPQVTSHVIGKLRDAIKANSKVRVRYRKRRGQEIKNHILLPYGFILGHRHYLIARIDNPKANKFLPFSIPNIEEVEFLDEGFERDETFSFQEYTERSFGVFQEEPFDVVWRFTPEASMHAKEYLFHPSQKMEEEEDGSLLVTFHAGGLHEMIWHLYAWGEHVEVIEPKKLADEVNPYRRSWIAFP